jgi:uncharacterized surface protein with fasciclin (FAS1) repeats
MNIRIQKSIKLSVIFLACCIAFTQCKKEEEVVPESFIAEKIAADPELSLLNAAIKQAKLETYTQGPGPFTILAPTNAALNEAGITSATLPTIDSLTLTSFLLNHFQNIKRTSFEFPDGPNAPMVSMAGFSNFSSKNKTLNKTYINGATVLAADINCGNGIIHKIDKALIMPNTPISTLLLNNPNYSLMVQAITKAALTSTYAPAATAPITVFAIDNPTMIANGYDATTIAALTAAQITTLTNILRYNIVPGRNFSNALKSGQVKTNFGTNITIAIGTPITVKGISNPTPFNVTSADIIASNGVIHQISGLLKP